MFDTFIDLSRDSPDREMIALLCEQDVLPMSWVNESLEIPWDITASLKSDQWRTIWRQVLRNTEGMSAEDWKEEIEELEWHDSPSYRPGIPRQRPYKPRSAKLPEGVIVPFFAKRSGQIPKSGTPVLDGVALPKGSRRPVLGAAYWSSEEPVVDVGVLISRLAALFPHTGLWPVAWSFPDAPESYMGGGHHEIDEIGATDVFDLLAQRWSRYHGQRDGVGAGIDFPGLAATQGALESGSPPALSGLTFTESAYLLLVPCNRPADAITALGGIGAVTPAPLMSAVLRSWEERFGAVLFQAEPEVTRLTVTRPPQDQDQALKLAGEFQALNPGIADTSDNLEVTAAALLREHSGTCGVSTFTLTTWTILWPKDLW